MKYKIICYIPLHYGREYLGEAIKSVHDHVEKIIILYTKNPSFGFGTDTECPEFESELKEIAYSASNKIEWVNIEKGTEGDHRSYIYEFVDGHDGILTIDADEVFDPIDLPLAIDNAMKSTKRYIGISGYINFWKSFNYACYDGFTPIRFTNLHNEFGEDVVSCKVYHFSTAQKIDIMEYKLLIHGHKDEIRPNWFEDVYKAWTVENNFGNLHLVSENLWNAVPYDKNQLPDLLKKHLNFNKDVI
jgi:hypothetical protein